MRYFNPLPRKEGDSWTKSGLHGTANFNPLPRKEGDLLHEDKNLTDVISIHSLVKRETRLRLTGAIVC